MAKEHRQCNLEDINSMRLRETSPKRNRVAGVRVRQIGRSPNLAAIGGAFSLEFHQTFETNECDKRSGNWR